MTTPYQKLVRRAEGIKNRNTKNNNYQVHKISFDDSDDSSRIDIPNIFLNDRDEPSPSPPKRKKLEKEEVVSQNKTESQNNFDFGGRLSKEASPAKRKVSQPELQAEFDPQQQQIVIGESDIEPNSSLSLLQIVKLNLGEYLFRNFYPMKKIIYLNNNNDYQNELNLKGHQLKNNSEKEIIHFSNSLKVSKLLLAIALFLKNLLGQVYIYTWIAIILLQFIAQSLFFKMPIQYGADKVSMIVLLVNAIVIQLISDWLSFRKRSKWQDNNSIYRIYYNNGEIGEWINTKAIDIKAGNIYKLSKGQVFPTDCVLLYSQHSLLQINERDVVTQLTENPSEIVLKQTAIKGEIILPISGYITYEIANPEYSDFQILGKLNLQEPSKVTHGVGMDNIVLRGSCNSSDVDIICLALETGIDSFFLKELQYPLLMTKNWQYSRKLKSKRISNQIKQEVKEYESRVQGCNLQKKVESTILFMLLFYFLLVGIAVLARFAFNLTTSTLFYTSSNSVPIWHVLIYHLTNYIIIIPVSLLPLFKLFIVISGAITEHNISKRSLNLTTNILQEHRRTSSLMESAASVRNQQLLDNQKIIFPLTIKDYNLLPELSKIDTIITTIDTFRDNSAFTLHSIRVKEINHNFMTSSIDVESISIEDIKTMKYFMQVALLTTTKADTAASLEQNKNYDDGIEEAAKKYFNLKKNKNAMGETSVGDFLVKQMFHIKPIYEFPYKVVFLQAVKEEDAEDNKRILVLIRGNPKIILDKCYGKQVKYTQQSRELEDKKGFHVQLVAKLTLHLVDAIQIQKAYTNNTYEKKSFYKNLDKYISKVESMGLLVFVNQFHQKKIGDSSKNPILNKSIINFSTLPKFDLNAGGSDLISSQMMPNIIIIAPSSKSHEPVFQSIHTITNLLINPYIFHLGISEVGSKILHQKPNDLDSMFTQLDQQKILVWNGWDQKDILYTVDVMKKYGRNLLFYYEKDEYMYLSKQAQCSVAGSLKGFDTDKYSDINFTSRSSISFLYLLQLIKYDSEVLRQGLLSILLSQIGKYTFYFVIELINIFYTKGTALMIIKSPLFLVIQVVLFLDVLYYANWDDSIRAYTFTKGQTYFKYVVRTVLQKVAQGVFVTMVCLYSTQTPSSSDGTPHPYQYSYFLIAFVVVHILVFQKLLNSITQSLSIYKVILIIVQVLFIYLGFVIVSVVDKYFYYGILWNVLSSGNLIVTGIACIWVSLVVPGVRLLRVLVRGRALKLRSTKKQF